jgi:hypothetical protein
MKEKRSQKRQKEAAEAEIRFKIQGELCPGDGGRTAVITDVSPNGMGLFAKEPIELGQILKFIGAGNLPGPSTRGQVIWTADSREGIRVGVKFI